MRFTWILCAFAAVWLGANGPAQAQALPEQATEPAAEALPTDVPGLRMAANEAYSGKDYPRFRDAMRSLHRLRPNNSEYMYQLVLAHALLDEKAEAYTIMLKMQKQGGYI